MAFLEEAVEEGGAMEEAAVMVEEEDEEEAVRLAADMEAEMAGVRPVGPLNR